MKMKRMFFVALLFTTTTMTSLSACSDSTSENGKQPGGTTGTGDNSKIAQFDYYKYEGKDAWFDREIDHSRQFFNPIVAGFYPDPSICRKGDTYYLVHSSFSFFPGVPIFTSKDLVNWKQIGHVLDRPSQLNIVSQDISAGIFAPTIEYNPYNDTFYMITTFSWDIGNFYVKSKDPSKGWSDPILLPEVQGIDPSFYFDEDGKGYIVHNAEPDNGPDWDGQRAIRIHEFDVENDRTIGKNKEIVRGGVNPADKPIWIEAPHLYKINGYYYLMCAEGGTGGWHSEVIFRSSSPWGAFVPGNNNPILTQRTLPNDRNDKITCAGHADMIETPNGEWWAVFLACRPYGTTGDMYNTGRETFLLPVTWKDEFPTILPNGEQIPVVVDKPGLTQDSEYLTGNFTYNQEFNDKTLDYSWIYIRTPREEFYKIEDGKLKITPLSISIEEKKSPSVILRRQQHTNFSAETKLEFTPKSDNDFAGFTVFQNEKYQFLFGKTIVNGKESLIVYRMENNKEVLASITLSKKDAPVMLKVEGKGRYYDFLYSYDGKSWSKLVADSDASNLSTERSGGFVGACIGLYATSNHKVQ